MENASKALLMAAGVLIGVLILSLAVYLFVSFGTTSSELHKQQDSDRINQFNSQFTSYEGKEGVTIYDVITVANLATENNIYYEFNKRNNIPSTDTNDFYISVVLKNEYNNNELIERGYDSNAKTTRDKYNEIISKYVNSMQIIGDKESYLNQYECKVYISSITQRVYKVVFTKK